MGGAPSSVYIDYPDLCYWKRIFDVLDLSDSDVRSLYRTYHCMDVDNLDKANIQELVAWLASHTPFMMRVFSILDTYKTGKVDFGNFVVSLWNFCALSKNDLISFAFDMYDTSHCGVLFVHDLRMMLEEVYGNHKSLNRNATKLDDTLSSLREICFDLPMFHSFVKHHGALLYPVFMTHKRLRSTIIGNFFWRRVTSHRARYPSLLSLKKLQQLLTRSEYAREHGVSVHTGNQYIHFRTSIIISKDKDKPLEAHSVTADVHSDGTSRHRPAEEDIPTPRLHSIGSAAYYLPEENNPAAHPTIIRVVKHHHPSRVAPIS